jgi:hypothetical protein
VLLPGMGGGQKKSSFDALGIPGGIPGGDLSNMSADQKRELMKQFGGMP